MLQEKFIFEGGYFLMLLQLRVKLLFDIIKYFNVNSSKHYIKT